MPEITPSNEPTELANTVDLDSAEAVVHTWTQSFSNTSGSDDRPGRISGRAFIFVTMQILDIGATNAAGKRIVTIRELDRDGSPRRCFNALEDVVIQNLEALKDGTIPYFLIELDGETSTPESIYRHWTGYDGLGVRNNAWAAEELVIAPNASVRLRTVNGEEDTVFVFAEQAFRHRIFHGSAHALAEVGLARYEEVLTRYQPAAHQRP
jgi:hypothetical protein